MNNRLVISLLCAGALAFACGPRPHAEVQAFSATNANKSVLSAMASALPRRHADDGSTAPERLDTRFAVQADTGAVHFDLSVRNVSKRRVELTFASGKAYDFVVLDSVGREVWHWSAGRLFTQTVQNKLLAQGQAMRVSEEWKHPAIRGHFTAVALVNSPNFPIQQRTEFVLP